MRKEKGFTVVELAVVVGIFLVMISALAPFVRMARQRAHNMNCANNLRKISLALHAYAADHDEAFPAGLGELYPNYIEDQAVFDCRATRRAGTKDEPDYDYRAGLTEQSPPKEIIVEDAGNNHGRAGRNMLRIDGSVEWIRAR